MFYKTYVYSKNVLLFLISFTIFGLNISYAAQTVSIQKWPCTISNFGTNYSSTGFKEHTWTSIVRVTISGVTTTSNQTCVIREYDMIYPEARIAWNGASPSPINSCASTSRSPYLGFSAVNIPSTIYNTTAPIQYSIGDGGLKRCGVMYLCSGGTFIDNSSANNCSCIGGSTNVNGLCIITSSIGNGICWVANGVNVSTAPTTGLCNFGIAGTVTDGWARYNWSCNGIGGWTNISCSANKTTNTTTNSTIKYCTAGKSVPCIAAP